METRMDVRHFFEVVRMWKPMALRNFEGGKKNRCTGKKYAQRKRVKERKKGKKTGSVYRIVKSSTIYTASFKTQMSSTI